MNCLNVKAAGAAQLCCGLHCFPWLVSECSVDQLLNFHLLKAMAHTASQITCKNRACQAGLQPGLIVPEHQHTKNGHIIVTWQGKARLHTPSCANEVQYSFSVVSIVQSAALRKDSVAGNPPHCPAITEAPHSTQCPQKSSSEESKPRSPPHRSPPCSGRLLRRVPPNMSSSHSPSSPPESPCSRHSAEACHCAAHGSAPQHGLQPAAAPVPPP